MVTSRRIVVGLLVVVLVAVGWTAWQAYHLQRDLVRAQDAAQRLRTSIEDGDAVARSAALGDLRVNAASADTNASSMWWEGLTYLPLIGDDVTGVRTLSSSLDTVAANGIQPLADAVDDVDGIAGGGQVDLDRITALQEPMAQSAQAFETAHADVAALDSSGYAGALRTRFETYADDLAVLDRAVGSASSAVDVLPEALGQDGRRNYLLVFENNAEIRGTGGLPGSWAQVSARNGKLTIERQGTGAGFARLDQPVVELTDEEDTVYSDLLGTFFLDANFTPDYPRAAELWKARWEQDYAPRTLDGVISLDPVALGYLLRSTGPIRVGDVTLAPDNAVEQLLNHPYLTLDGTAQDAYFARAAAAIFAGVTRGAGSAVEMMRALSQANDEGRFHFASYDASVAGALTGSKILGALASDDGDDPHLQIGLNDATGSKMSYYLRYRARVASVSCASDVQTLQGTMTLNQTISSTDAAQLPESVTGPGSFGTTKGLQTVSVRLYSPTGGTLGDIRIDGKKITYDVQPLEGRQVASLLIQLDGPDDVVLNWSATAAEGQTGNGTVGVTPSVVAGSKSSTFPSSC